MSHYRYIIKNNLFDEPVAAFLANGDTPNLLNSTFLEMTEFIRQADTKMVMLHFADEYWPRVKHISYVRTFKLLKDAADNVRVRSIRHPARRPAVTSCVTQQCRQLLSRLATLYLTWLRCCVFCIMVIAAGGCTSCCSPASHGAACYVLMITH